MAGILIVEDDKDLREMLKSLLTSRKHMVIEAVNGREAIQKFKPFWTDLVITDLIMPDEDGLKVIIRLKELKPEIKIIAITGGGKAGPVNYLNMAKTLGAHYVLPKPFSVNELISKIDFLLNIEQTELK
jgi:DNA-binding response OmpR family regulator